MRIALTGASGLVGHPLARHFAAAGHDVTALARTPVPGFPHLPYALGDAPDLRGFDALVHAAFDHLPGRYRGGEGDDPAGFRARNVAGSVRLFDAARAAGVARLAFLSSRAVYEGHPPGTRLDEGLPPRPVTLYGRVKAEVEAHLAGLGGTSLRVTGVYGPPVPGRPHKWAGLLAAFARGEAAAPRVSTEVHADDLAAAALLALGSGLPALDVSDIRLDRADLLGLWSRLAGIDGPVPPRADPGGVSAMTSARLRAMGWRPRGEAGVAEVLRALAVQEKR